MDPNLEKFIRGMPKCELHIHLEGCITPQLAQKLATRNNIPLPESITKASTAEGFMFQDLAAFLAIYYPALQVLQTSTDFHDLALEYLTKANEQNVKHCELFFDPQAHTSRGIPFPTILSGLRAGLTEVQRRFGISASLIMCFTREWSAEYAMSTLMEALSYKESIIGVGLDSDGRGNPPNKFAAVFARARKEGFLITTHCDVDQKDIMEDIRQAVEDIQVDRIDHGENIAQDPRLVEAIKARSIGLTCCPISNAVVAEDSKRKEIIDLLRRGVKVTINSDDPPYFRSYTNENMMEMTQGTDLTKEELLQFQRNAFEISWISSWRRSELLQMLEEYSGMP